MVRPVLFLAFLLSAAHLPAQVLINEISAANMAGVVDGDGDREDWVELHNSGSTPVSLAGWFLSDDPANPQKWTFPNGVTLAAGAYRTVFCSGKNKFAGGYLHTSFKITQTKGESVVLTQPNGTMADSYTFTTPNQANHSYGRSPNAGPNWKIFTTPTPGGTNTGATFQSYASNVQASESAGFYTGNVSVALTNAAGLTIRYTTDGTEPTGTSPVYAAPLTFTATTVLKARAYSSDPQVLPGFVRFNTYFVNENHTIPVISIAGTNLNILVNGSFNRPFGTFEYFKDNDRKATGYGEFNKHGNDSWAYPQRGVDWITRDQMGYNDELKEKFFPERTRNKFQRVILKAGANDNYPSSGGAHIRDSYVAMLALKGGLNVDVRTHRSCIVYVNGQYWGVYDLREKVDDSDFTDYYYDQDELDVDYIKTWGSTWAEYGTMTDWNTLKGFILGTNMTVPANYNYVSQQLDFLSLIDYIIINQHSVCKDWLNWNTSWWRGRNAAGGARRWRYTLWDMDATFGHYTNYTGIPNTGPTADPCDVELISNSGDPQNHIDIFMALYANPDFKSMYVNRYAELLNGPLSCAYMNALLDSMTNEIAPEMARHCTRWGGTVAQWNQNVNQVHNFINTRCALIDQSIEDCYEVTGPFVLTVHVSPAGSSNQVMVNNITPTVYPYVGDFFGGVTLPLVAKPAAGWVFDHWEVSGNTFAPNQYADAIALALQTGGVVTAFFVPDGPCPPPTDLTLTAATMNWADQPAAGGYVVRYREAGATAWTEFNTAGADWNVDSLPGCRQWEVQVASVCPQGNSAFADFAFATPNHLQGFALADAMLCNNAPGVLDATFAGAAYQWDDGSTGPTRTVSAAGDYAVQLSLDGCTAADTAHVALIDATAAVQPVLCPGEAFVLDGQTFDAQNPAGQVVLENMGAAGCDSLVNVSIQWLTAPVTLLAATSCDPTATGTDTVLLSSFTGCDSLVVTTTTLAPYSQTLLAATSCNPAAVGTDTVLLANYLGCDSLVITNTALAPYSQTLLFAGSCNPAAVGTDTVLLINSLGCDSLVITTTAFDPAGIPVTALFALHCDPAAAGIDTLVLTSFTGCDSLVVTTTTLAPFSQTLLAATSCNPAAVGVDTILLTNYLGCDSLVITTTIFDPVGISVTSLFNQNCDPAATGVDTVLLTNIMGCDSLVITTTTLAPFSQTQLIATSCNPAAIGIDTILLTNALGCDSLVVTTTTFDPAGIAVTALFQQNCDPGAVGIDTVILTGLGGCDSLVVTTTTLAPVSQTFLSATACDPGATGIDTVLLTNHFGCDSLVITTTTLAPVSQTLLNATSCNPTLVGLDTVLLTNVYGCDSLVITATALDPAGIAVTALAGWSCDPGAVGIDTVILTGTGGCDSLVVTTTSLAPVSATYLSATTCDLAAVGPDTLLLANQYGCDSLVITDVAYAGLDLEASALRALCFGAHDGVIRLDTVRTPALPVEIVLQNRPAQWYSGAPLSWSDLTAGVYELTATNAAGCSLTADVAVIEDAALQLDLTGLDPLQPLVLHRGDSAWVQPAADFTIAAAQWTPATGVQCPDCAATYFAPLQSGVYTLTASDPNGCAATATLRVQVKDDIRVYVPNAIRPGSGGENAALTVWTGPEVERIRALRLFDRWGNLVFEQTDLAPNAPSNWDGAFRGKPVEPGVLVWMAVVVTRDGRVAEKAGDILVVR